LGANERCLSANESGLGALASRARSLERFALKRARVLERRLVSRRELEHRARFVECLLLHVSSFLGMIKGLLIDIPGGLAAVDSRLTVSQDAFIGFVAESGALALLIQGDLLLVDAQLVPVADELHPFTERLLKIGQALFTGELSLA
jgi:hypothetical protein